MCETEWDGYFHFYVDSFLSCWVEQFMAILMSARSLGCHAFELGMNWGESLFWYHVDPTGQNYIIFFKSVNMPVSISFPIIIA